MVAFVFRERELSMVPPICQEGFSASEMRPPVGLRYAEVLRRLSRLERMAADPFLVASLIAHGRYLRLCAAIACASATVDHEYARLHAISTRPTVVLH